MRIIAVLSVLSAALSLTVAPPASAQDQPATAARIAHLHAMMADASFEEAVVDARAILALTDLAAAQRNATLESLAIAQFALRDPRGARETLAILYGRDPDHRLLDREASPEVQTLFDRARSAHSPPLPLTIESATPRTWPQRTAPVLQVRLSAGMDAVGELRLSYRQGDARDFLRVTMEHSADFTTAQARIPVLDGEAAYTMEWFVEALAPSQAVIGTLGNELEPLSLALPVAAARGVQILRVVDPRVRRDEGPGVLGSWWFWTAVGVVVVGGIATGAYVATRPIEQTPCGTAGCGTLPPPGAMP